MWGEESFKKYRFLLFLLLLAIGFPFLLHMVFTVPAPSKFLEAKWGIGDALVYFGALLGATATIYAINHTIAFNLDIQEKERTRLREDRRLAIMPNLSSECRPLNELVPPKENRLFVKLPLAQVPKDCSRTPPAVYTDAYTPSKDQVEENNRRLDFEETYCVFEYSLSNAGAGNALEVNFHIQIDEETHADSRPSLPVFSLQQNMKRSFVFILPSSIIQANTNCSLITFSFSYRDIASVANYTQTETIKFLLNTESRLVVESEHMLSVPAQAS